ncbi:MAG: LysM domain-containing protein [Pseudomonadota bacterium]
MNKLWLGMITFVLMLAIPYSLFAQDNASAAGQEIEVRDDHPGEYVVQEGDTLWDIAGRFLTRPWQWPAIWQANPQIDNPHLIYPGDRLSLVYIDGQPRLLLNANADQRLSPQIRREAITGPVTSIPLDVIEEFLEKPRVVSANQLADMPYVVANEDRRYFAAEPNRTFVRGMSNARVGDEVIVARLNAQFVEYEKDGQKVIRQNRMRSNRGAVSSDERPINSNQGRRLLPFVDRVLDRGGEIVAYQLWEVARARVVQTGEPATLELTESEIEVAAGDYVMPMDPYLYDLTFFPRAPGFSVPEGAAVIGLNGGDFAVGHYQVVSLGIGANDGVSPGHTFSVFHPGDEVRDPFYEGLRGRPEPINVSGRNVDLPDQYVAQLMVFRAFDRVSFGLIVDGKRGVQRGDLLAHPDRRL